MTKLEIPERWLCPLGWVEGEEKGAVLSGNSQSLGLRVGVKGMGKMWLGWRLVGGVSSHCHR